MPWEYFLSERSLFPLSLQTASQIPDLEGRGPTEEDSWPLVELGWEGTGPGGCAQAGGWVRGQPPGPSKEAASGEACFSFLSGQSRGPAKPSLCTGGSAAVLSGILERTVFRAALHT